MRLVRIDDLKGNEILAVPVLSESEVILIQSDTELKDEYIEKLKGLHLESVYIKEETDRKKHVYKVDETAEQSQVLVKKVLQRHIYKHNEELKKVGQEAQRILNSVLSEPEIINDITEIRNISTDMYTHCVNVCILSTIMAIRLKMTEKQIRNVSMGAILHDIGLRYIQAPYMNINEDEMSPKDSFEYKKHTIYGYSSLEDENWLPETAKEIILFHHERVDGSGYPFKHHKEKLKMEVRLVSICDDFDSLVSGIGARKMKIYEAIEYIKMHSGHYYDTNIANMLMSSVAVYPEGIKVVTNEGEVGIVIKQNKQMPERPVLKMLKYADGNDYNVDIRKDLSKLLTLFIVDTQ